MSAGEIWRDVPGVPGVLVSSEGRVMVTPYRPTPGKRKVCGGIPHFGTWDKTEYRFIIRVNGQTHRVHRLVALAFHGEPPEGKPLVMHKDENSANNRAANLEWGSPKQNANAPGFLDYCRSRTGENSTSAKARRKNGIVHDCRS